MSQLISRHDLRDLIGSEIGISDWQRLDQPRIDLFADATGDHQFIHVDAKRAAEEAPFKTTIAHGFLTLALLPAMAFECLPEVRGRLLSLNYGFEKVRFLAPVPSGSSVRGRFVLSGCLDRSPEETLCRYQVTMDIENGSKSALFAEWLCLLRFEKQTSNA